MKAADEAVAAESEAMFRIEAKAEVSQMELFSMEWTAMTSDDAFTQDICNTWALKETPTSIQYNLEN